MARKSRCKALPQALRTELDRLLADGRHSLDEVVAHLRKLGVDVSRSSVHRYSQDFEQVASVLRQGRETARAFVQELGAIPEGNMGQVLVEMVNNVAYRNLQQATIAEAPAAAKDIMLMAKAVKDAMGTAKLNAELEIKIHDRLKKEMAEEAKAKLEEASGQGSLDPAAAAEALRILGFE